MHRMILLNFKGGWVMKVLMQARQCDPYTPVQYIEIEQRLANSFAPLFGNIR